MSMPEPDWNVVATTYDREFHDAKSRLSRFGEVRPSVYRNVLLMKVTDIGRFLESLERSLGEDASLANSVSRVVPVTHGFRFATPEEFESKAGAVVSAWLPELGGKKFHVRMHCRGFKGKLSSEREEQFLGHFVLERLQEAGTPAEVDFDDPDIVIAVETLGQEAGISRWTRQQLREHELLKID
jgi:tRNA(Ser,Leu) C12 N-acetylase TAN1